MREEGILSNAKITVGTRLMMGDENCICNDFNVNDRVRCNY